MLFSRLRLSISIVNQGTIDRQPESICHNDMIIFRQVLDQMNFFFFLLLLVLCLGGFPLLTNAIRCYKCDASDECATISTKTHDYSSENVEVIDCEYFCWKSVSLGNVYRGCANRRCAISHTMGTFSSSVCCETDYCNGSRRVVSSTFLLLTIIVLLFRIS